MGVDRRDLAVQHRCVPAAGPYQVRGAVRAERQGLEPGDRIDHKVAFTNRKDFGKEAREAAWAHQQRTLHGLESAGAPGAGREKAASVELGQMAEDARWRAEITRLRELHTRWNRW